MFKKIISVFLCLMTSSPLLWASPGDTTTYTVDVSASKLHWSCDVHHGHVLLKKGTIKMIGNQLVDARITVQMDSISDLDIDYVLMQKTLQNILRSDVFFNTKKYPEAIFRLIRAKQLPGGKYWVQGDLDLTGVSNCIYFNIFIEKHGHDINVTSDPFNVDRLGWGIASYSKHIATSEKNFVVSDTIFFNFQLLARETNK